MLREILVDLDGGECSSVKADDPELYGKSLAVQRLIEAEDPERTVYLSGYTPLIASGLGFAGKLNLYGVSLLGGNLQGSRSGGLITAYLTRMKIAGIRIAGDAGEPQVLVVNRKGSPRLSPLTKYGKAISGTADFAMAIYKVHGPDVAFAVTDPSTTGFRYNAVACNDQPRVVPHRVAGRGSTRFGRNNLVGIVVERPDKTFDGVDFDRRAVSAILRKVHKARMNPSLRGSAEQESPMLGGTYGAAAKARFDQGHGLTNLFRSAHVPEPFYRKLLPENIVRDQLRMAQANQVKVSRHSCMPGCPNRCSQMVLLPQTDGKIKVLKAGEWETYQGLINIGIIDDVVRTAAEVIEHSNNYAYDHIEGLVTMAALALVTETKADTGVRYGDRDSVMGAFEQAVQGETELGLLVREGAAAVERHYGLERHFTVGGHALPFHNGRTLLQTGIGLSWTFGRHGEACAGPGRHNFLGDPYDPADHALSPEVHVLNTIHGMILYGALDECGMCFFIGPTLDTLVDTEAIIRAMGLEADAGEMVRRSAQQIRAIHAFNEENGIGIEPLPRVFYEQPTRGNKQSPDEAVVFDVPFEVIRDHGARILDDVAEGRVVIDREVLEKSRARYG